MFVLHGKRIKCGVKLASLPPEPLLSNGAHFIPFPPVQTVSASLTSGLQVITQLGTYPLRDIIMLNLKQPTDVTVSCLLAQDYEHYDFLSYLFSKDIKTKHFPLVDLRVALGETFHDERTPVLEFCSGVAKGISIKFGDRVATIDFSFVFPIGALLPNAPAQKLPPYFLTSVDPARRITTTCSLTTANGAPFLGLSNASVTSANLNFNTNNNLALTMPNLEQVIFGYLPTVPTATFSIINEGTPQYSATITLALPPEVDLPPVFSPPETLLLTLRTDGGITIELLDCKIQSITPTISHESPIQFTISLIGKGMAFRRGA